MFSAEASASRSPGGLKPYCSTHSLMMRTAATFVKCDVYVVTHPNSSHNPDLPVASQLA